MTFARTGISVVLGLILLLPMAAHASKKAMVTVKVVDENDKPVEAAEVGLCLSGGCLSKDLTKGVTNAGGVFVASGTSDDGVIGGAAEKEGYYYSTFHYDLVTSGFTRWKPWNKEIKVVLRPKVNPVPMFVRWKRIKIPYPNKEIGFDLTKFDWVAPYGVGSVPDFVFSVDVRYKNQGDRSAKLTTTFSNKYDGIQEFSLANGGDFGVGSRFRTPRYAPEDGYHDRHCCPIVNT